MTAGRRNYTARPRNSESKGKKMDVIALVGPSGTGKSHRALIVAHKNGADAIIDDGILIKDGKILAGHSAKKEQNKIMAVRRAIFVLPGHAEEVRKAIENSKPHRILILGTSENMVQKITKALRLPPIAKIIRIEDIATRSDCLLYTSGPRDGQGAQSPRLEPPDGTRHRSRACLLYTSGCISLQPAECCPSPQERIKFRPTPEEIAEVGIYHLSVAPDGIISFGQGCEGEPSLAADNIAAGIKLCLLYTSRCV